MADNKEKDLTATEQLEQIIEIQQKFIDLMEEYKSWPPEKQQYMRENMPLYLRKKLKLARKSLEEFHDMLDKIILEKIEADRAVNTKKWSQ